MTATKQKVVIFTPLSGVSNFRLLCLIPRTKNSRFQNSAKPYIYCLIISSPLITLKKLWNAQETAFFELLKVLTWNTVASVAVFLSEL